MKYLLLLLIANLQFACSQLKVDAQGFKLTNTNLKNVSWTPTHFTADEINTSTPLNSNWRGINKLGNTLVSGAIGIAVPGSGTVPAVTRGAAIIAPTLSPTPAETILTK